MCTLYRMEDKDWVAKWAQDVESVINPMPAYQIYADQLAPVIRNMADGRRQVANCRWGLPAPFYVQKAAAEARAAKARAKGLTVDMEELIRMEPDRGTPNVRKLNLPHWKRWFGIEHRCLVPITSFAEPDPKSKTGNEATPNAWFSAAPEKPLMFFAGLWVAQWKSVRKVKDGLTTDDLFGFLTTDPNNAVRPVHEKAMPVLLRTREETELWMTGPWDDARVLARPLPDDAIMITSREPYQYSIVSKTGERLAEPALP